MYSENKTTEHMRDSRGRVEVPNNQRRKNPVSQFLGYTAMVLALTLAVTGLLLYTSMQTNAANVAKIRELQNQPVPMTQAVDTQESVQSPERPKPNEPNLQDVVIQAEPVKTIDQSMVSRESKLPESRLPEPVEIIEED